MVLVDTSVWIEHFSRGVDDLSFALNNGLVLAHPFVIGELALGSLKDRAEILNLLSNLPQAARGEDREVMAMVEKNRLFGKGIGWVDAHLLASARLSACSLWTRDRSLAKMASAWRINYQ